MAALLLALLAASHSVVDSYTMGKEVQELARYQHQSGGFYDSGREANARDTFYAVWIASLYGAFMHIDARQCLRWIQTLHNRDGGSGLYPGAKSSVFATYCYFQLGALVAPELLESARIVEFLKSAYDSVSGLFRNTQDEEPTIEATYYAYELLSRFREADLGWINTFGIRTLISDHLVEDHFEFENVSPLKAQLWAGSIAKFTSLTVPYHRVSEYIVARVMSGIKENKLDNEEASAAARILHLFGDEAIPASLVRWIKTSGSLADLFHVNTILLATGEISKFFEVRVLAMENDNKAIDIEKESVSINSMVRLAVTVTSLNRFVNPFIKVNMTSRIGDEEAHPETLQIDYQTGLFNSHRMTTINKLGQLSVEVVAWAPFELGPPLWVTKSIRSHVSLPIEITSDARLTADELIPLKGEVEAGVNFRVVLEGKFDESLEIHESTMTTFSVTDSAGALLHHKSEDFKPSLEFSWQLPAIALPAGQLALVVEVGDKVNGIHTRKEFVYKVNTRMAATKIEVPEDLKLSDVLKVKMTPALASGNDYVPFRNEKFFDELVDAAGEAFYPQTASETQHYSMRIKVGGVVVKTAEGEVVVNEENELSVEFESSVDDNLDFATGFSIDFQFDAENSAPIPLIMDKDIFVHVRSKIVAEGEPLASSKVEYGSTIKAEFKLKDEEGGRYLTAGRAFPVLVILSQGTRKVLLEKKCKIDDDKFLTKIQIGAAVPDRPVIVAVQIRKGTELVPVLTTNGTAYESDVVVTGTITYIAKVREAGEYAIVDFRTSYDGQVLPGTAFSCRILDGDAVIADIPLAQKKKASRLSWESKNKKGTYTLELRRLTGLDDPPLFTKQITIENSVVGFIAHLPVEGIAIAISFALFVWSVRLRKGIQKPAGAVPQGSKPTRG
jgi:hypothetical protein